MFFVNWAESLVLGLKFRNIFLSNNVNYSKFKHISYLRQKVISATHRPAINVMSSWRLTPKYKSCDISFSQPKKISRASPYSYLMNLWNVVGNHQAGYFVPV